MKHYDHATGYKATDQNMRCQGFQFELGRWYRHEGDVKLCKTGFHFCKYPSGPWAYYNGSATRIFKIEAKDAYEEYTPGADLKIVCREIRLTEELKVSGDRNTGNRNTGDRNTGNRNTGHRNTGNRNTGNWNTGNRNTGNGNTGHWNTGHGNTGHGNATDSSSGFFCQKEAHILCFDKPIKLSHAEFLKKYPKASRLIELLGEDEAFSYSEFKNLPGWTLKKCKSLHQKHIAGRKSQDNSGAR